MFPFFALALDIYGCTNRERVQTVHDVVDYNAQTVERNLPEIKQNIMMALTNHQLGNYNFVLLLRLIKVFLCN